MCIYKSNTNEKSLKQNLEKLKGLTIDIAKNRMDPFDSQYFNASKAGAPRLGDLAVKQSSPAIRALPLWGDAMAKQVTEAVLAAKGILSKKQKKCVLTDF